MLFMVFPSGIWQDGAVIRPHPFHSKSFPIDHSSALPSDAIYNIITGKASINKPWGKKCP
jgi:Tol biopolymer transport system component